MINCIIIAFSQRYKYNIDIQRPHQFKINHDLLNKYII